MKTLSKLNLFVLAAVAVAAVACKSKSASTSGDAPAANSESAVSSKGNSVMDSLNITDPDAKKICALYDDAVTDYMNNWKTLATDTSKEANDKRKALDAKWKQKEQEIKPQVEAWRQKVATNPAEAMKFAQFSAYESRRLMAIMADYEKAMMKNMPTGVPTGK